MQQLQRAHRTHHPKRTQLIFLWELSGMRETQASTARLFIALSKDRTRTLVVRRGPAKQVATFNWNRQTDKIVLGQWFKGRIYEHRLDISPDGLHWIYLALGGGGNTHTVVAKTPYLKALDFYPWTGTWGGGGKFISNRAYALAGKPAPNGRKLSGQFEVTEHTTSSRLGLFDRLQRNGWSYMLNGDYTRKLENGWVLRKHLDSGQKFGRSAESEWHSLSHNELDLHLERPDWDWAGIDGEDLIFTESGKLFRASLYKSAEEPYRARLIHDFNAYKFEAIRAPY